ncbi:MAG: hypothetical protein AAGF95_33115 [Chloroflexota bacterium]
MIQLHLFLRVVRAIAPQLQTGLNDPEAALKLQQEWQELQVARHAHDQLGALMEIADVAYYATKALHNRLLDDAEAHQWIAAACTQLDLAPEVALQVLMAKYDRRIANERIKDDALERQAVINALHIQYCFTNESVATAAGGDPDVWYQPTQFYYHHRPVILVDLVDPITECQIPLVPVYHLTIGFDQ